MAEEESFTQGRSEAARPRWPWFAGGVAVLAVTAIIVATATGVFGGAEEPGRVASPTDSISQPPSLTPSSPPPTTPDAEPDPEPAPPALVDIPSVQHMPYTPVWNPPDHGEFFWQIVDPAYGFPETGGTDYLLAHACESQTCAGDELRTLEVGDALTYLGETYIVEERREIMKTDIADQDIWYHDADRIVIITCIIETTWDQSDKNDLFIATKYSG